MTYQEKWDWYDKVFRPMIEKAVLKRNKVRLWYEVYIDLDECFEKWFDFMYKYPNLAVGALVRWLERRDKWYWSPAYVKELDKAYEKYGEACFSAVLADSFK